MTNDDLTLRVIDSEFAIFGGRPQHRPTYDTGRKAHDGTGADPDASSGARYRDGQRRNRLVAVWTDEGVQVTFEDPA